MWNVFDDEKLQSTELYFEKILFVNHKHTFVFSTSVEKEFYYIIIDGLVHTCRLIDRFHSTFYDDMYIKKNDVKNVFSKSCIFYTDESEYLDWFKKNSFFDSSNDLLYHFYVDSEDYVVEFITDEMPKTEIKIKTGDGSLS